MNTPVADFVQRYAKAGTARLHMPGHKGRCFLGCGASWRRASKTPPPCSAASAPATPPRAPASASGPCCTWRWRPAAPTPWWRRGMSTGPLSPPPLCWIWKSAGCGRRKAALCAGAPSPPPSWRRPYSLPEPPAAVYLTSPDYLGGMAQIPALAQVCHQHGTLLLVDNAHGAYLRFLQSSLHPLDLGADLCCDSAHKTLPVLTGGAYLHLSPTAPAQLASLAKSALGLFGSTSPSYLTLASLDLCNRYLAEGYPQRLAEAVERLAELRERLTAAGWRVEPSDPLRVTVAAPRGVTGQELAGQLRRQGVECEYADRDFLVLMATPENTPEELAQAAAALGQCPGEANPPARLLHPPGGLCPPGNCGRGPLPGAGLRPAHGGLPASHPHCRFGGAHHPRGPGAVRLLRHRAGRGAGLKPTPLEKQEIENSRKALGPSGSFFVYPAITGSG